MQSTPIKEDDSRPNWNENMKAAAELVVDLNRVRYDLMSRLYEKLSAHLIDQNRSQCDERIVK